MLHETLLVTFGNFMFSSNANILIAFARARKHFMNSLKSSVENIRESFIGQLRAEACDGRNFYGSKTA